jgi:hypothetical protein
LEDLGEDGIIMSTRMDHSDIECEDVNFIYLTQDTVQWRGIVNTVMNLLFPEKAV